MPRSKCRPEDTYDAFTTNESFTAVARRFGVVRATLKRWWVAQFGEDAVRARLAPLPPEKRAEHRREARRQYREKNAEKIKEAKKTWRADNAERVRRQRRRYYAANQTKRQQINRAYYTENAERLQAAARDYRKENGDAMRRKERDYYTRNPEVLLFKCAKKRANTHGLPFTITVDDIRLAIPKDGTCPITRLPFERGRGKVTKRSMTLDRIVPTLGYVPGNIAVISHVANTIKQSCTDPDIFRRVADYVETALKQAAPCP